MLRFRTPAKLYSCETILERLAHDREHMTATLGPFIQEEDAVGASDTSPGIGTWPPPISPTSEMV